MARGQSVYQGAYTFPVQSTAAQSILQGAQAQAQMYSSLGQALGKVANTYFEKKDEDAQIESLAQDERVLNAIYGGRKDASGMPVMPTDFKEVKKDVKALFKGLGGREGVEMHLGRMKAEQRAASAEQRGVDMLAMQKEKHDRVTKDLRLRNEVLMKAFSPTTYTEELRTTIGGGTVGDVFPGLEAPAPREPQPSEYVPTIPQRNVNTGEVTQPTAQAPQYGRPVPLNAEDIEYLDSLLAGDPRDADLFRETWGTSGEGTLSAEEIVQGFKNMLPPDADLTAVRAHLGLPPAAGAPTARPKSTYASRLMGQVRGGIRTAREKLAEVEIPEIPLAEEVTKKADAPYTTAMSMEGFINSMQESGLGKEHMPYILELAKTKPTASAFGATGIMDVLRDNTYLSEAEAEQALVDTHLRFGMSKPSDAARAAWKKSARVIDPTDIKKQVTLDIKKMGLEEPLYRMRKLDELKAMLDKAGESPTAGIAAVVAFARIFEPTGILTEEDIGRWGGADKALTSNFMRFFLKIEEGRELLPDDITDLQNIRAILETSIKKDLQKGIPLLVSKLSKQYKLPESKIRELTYLSDLMPAEEQLSDDVARQIQNAKPGDEINDPAMGPLVVLYRMLDGRTVVHPKGKPNETRYFPAPEGFTPKEQAEEEGSGQKEKRGKFPWKVRRGHHPKF